MFKVDELLKASGARLEYGSRDAVVRGVSIDSRTIKPQEAFIAIKGVNFDGHNFIGEAIKKGAKAIIFNAMNHEPRTMNYKGVCFIKVKNTQKALGDIARYWRRKFSIPVIAVTGSNGKTTTKDMVACFLSAKYKVLKNEGTKNNQIGLSLALLNLNSRHDLAVVEIGTNHPGEIEYLSRICQPNIAIITNIGPAHLRYLRDLRGVFKEKYKLIENLRNPYLAIVNTDDVFLKRELLENRKKLFTIGYGIREKADFSAGAIKNSLGRLRFCVNQKYNFTLRTLGYYNIYNTLAAIATARLFGVEYRDILSRLADFSFPRSRLILIRVKKVRFIDDTYNSNPLSLEQALDALAGLKVKGRKIFVMGDMLELGRDENSFHSQAGPRIAKSCDILVTVGKLSKWAAKTAISAGLDIRNVFTCVSSQGARNILFNKIMPAPEDIVLVKGSRSMRMEEVIR